MRRPPPARVVVADPPWHFGDALPGKTRGAARNYDLMTVAAICDFALPRLTRDAVLFLWRVAAMQAEALEVVRAWGFTPKTELVWLKRTKNGKRHFGMGRIIRAEHETCLIATRGRPKPKVLNVRSTFEAKAGRHSQKPEAFFDLVETLFDGPYLELFARRKRDGWRCCGDEIDTHRSIYPGHV